MKKSSFVAMIMGTVGGVLLSIGMCMCLLPEWNAFHAGTIVGGIGLLELIITLSVWRRMTRRNTVRVSGRTLSAIIFGVLGTFLLGIGMCFVMVWSNLIFGIIAGILGIILMISMIPVVKGLK